MDPIILRDGRQCYARLNSVVPALCLLWCDVSWQRRSIQCADRSTPARFSGVSYAGAGNQSAIGFAGRYYWGTDHRAFYRGELAERIEAHAKANGGAMTRADLAAHTLDWCGTIAQDYRGYTVHEIPPNGQGIVALMALGMLAHFDMASHPVDGADSLHLQIMKLTSPMRQPRRHAGEGRRALDPAYLARAKRIT